MIVSFTKIIALVILIVTTVHVNILLLLLGKTFPPLLKIEKILFNFLHNNTRKIIFGSNSNRINWIKKQSIPKESVIIIGNHQSFVDSIFLGCLCAAWYKDYHIIIPKRHSKYFWNVYGTLRKNPIIYGYYELKNMNDEKRMKALEHNQQEYKNAFYKKNSSCFLTFPETTRRKGNEISDYEYLLNPKASTIYNFTQYLDYDITLIDFTVQLPPHFKSLYTFLRDNDSVNVWMNTYTIKKNTSKNEIQQLLDDIWKKKDALLSKKFESYL